MFHNRHARAHARDYVRHGCATEIGGEGGGLL